MKITICGVGTSESPLQYAQPRRCSGQTPSTSTNVVSPVAAVRSHVVRDPPGAHPGTAMVVVDFYLERGEEPAQLVGRQRVEVDLGDG